MLSSSDVDVPHLRHLGVSLTTLRKAYVPLVGPKKPRTQSEELGSLRREDLRQWTKAWDEYIRGEVVSKHCARLIQTFLTNTMARPSEETTDERDADASDLDEEVPPLRLNLSMARSVIKRWQANPPDIGSSASEGDAKEPSGQTGSKPRKTRKVRLREQFDRSIIRGQGLWGTPACKETGKVGADGGRMHGEAVREHL